MSQAERIRRFVLAHHIEPTKAAGKAELTIRAGEVSRAMGLHGRVPNICSVLGSTVFLEMAGLRLLDRSGPRQSTTTTFRYAVAEPGVGGAPVAPPRPAESEPVATRPVGAPGREPGEAANLIVVIPCAGTKAAGAGHLTLPSGRPVKFVADPGAAPKSPMMSYRHPDDAAPSGRSWRQVLVEYNRAAHDNPLSLLPAWRLYEPPRYPRVYADLVEACGMNNVFILSAGWGLVSAGFLLPNYDITFAAQAKDYKRRRTHDRYEDFAMLRAAADDRTVVFLGGNSYVPSFSALTEEVSARRIVFHYSRHAPRAVGCERRRFEHGDRRTWHYQCAYALMRGEIGLE